MDITLCFAFLILIFSYVASVNYPYSGNGETPEHWNDIATKELKKAKQIKPNIAVAKNVILFLGDGMGISTVTAARILKGQLKYKTGEEELLSFEEFPHVGLSKTYNQDAQTADSAGTATAYFAGVKTNKGVLGCDARARRGVCSSMVPGSELTNMLDWSLDAGKSVGMVTTSRITHATPAALYANTPQRSWEGDADMVDETGGCKDIAAQLVDKIDIHVVLGGGRVKFLKNNTMDPQSGLLTDGRMDGRDLTQVWKEKQAHLGRSHEYVWNRTAFNKVDPAKTNYLFGLFNKDHMDFEIDRDQEPSLEEMTDKAIEILRKNPKGYFLLVEGGRIDHGHHKSLAQKALHDTLAFDKAVMKGVSMTSKKDSLIIITADHSHTLTIGGYPTRGNPLFGFTDDRAGSNMLGLDKKPFTTLSYANGPGAYVEANNPVLRPDLTHVNTADKEYRQQSNVPLIKETHSGEDVAIYAQGPMAHLFHGVHEQNYIAHVMAYASCVGGYASADKCAASEVNTGNSFKLNLVFFYFIMLVNTLILC